MKRRACVIYSDSEDEKETENTQAKRLKPSDGATPTGPVESKPATAPPIDQPFISYPTLSSKERCAEVANFVRTGRSRLFRSDSAHLASAREEVFNECIGILGEPNFQKIGPHHLKKIYHILDRTYFKGCLSAMIKSESRSVSFRLSNRMTQRAGQLLTELNRPLEHELSISSFLLFEAFGDATSGASRTVKVNGLKCENRLQCLLRVMEHELVHLLFCIGCIGHALGIVDSKGAFRESYHGSTFQLAVQRFFGHTDWQHTLVTRDEVAFVNKGIEVGTAVKFVFEGKSYIGKVNRVQKRVTVLVEDNSTQQGKLFSDGKRYVKYYIPVEKCHKV